MDLFDVIGPVMVGPSSSHTAGAVRMGLAARGILGRTPEKARITLYGSFAATGLGHGTPLALTAGLLGLAPDNPDIRRSDDLAKQAGLAVTFERDDAPQVHPNTALMELSAGEDTARVLAASVGGGRIAVLRVDDLAAGFDCERPTLLIPHRDAPGCVAAVAGVLARGGVNIAAMTVHRDRRGGDAAMVIEMDQPLPEDLLRQLSAQPGLMRVRSIPAL